MTHRRKGPQGWPNQMGSPVISHRKRNNIIIATKEGSGQAWNLTTMAITMMIEKVWDLVGRLPQITIYIIVFTLLVLTWSVWFSLIPKLQIFFDWNISLLWNFCNQTTENFSIVPLDISLFHYFTKYRVNQNILTSFLINRALNGHYKWHHISSAYSHYSIILDYYKCFFH